MSAWASASTCGPRISGAIDAARSSGSAAVSSRYAGVQALRAEFRKSESPKTLLGAI
jgi:hypothetical protein